MGRGAHILRIAVFRGSLIIQSSPSTLMIKKRAYKTVVRVTFELPGEMVDEQAAVTGSFNDWDPSELPMKYVKSRDVWKAAVSLEPDSSYEFRYRIDDEAWANDPEADDYTTNPFFEENSVVHTHT